MTDKSKWWGEHINYNRCLECGGIDDWHKTECSNSYNTVGAYRNIVLPSSSTSPIIEGKHFDEGKLRVDLIPPEALEALAEVLSYGSKKYGDKNWEKGIHYTRLYGSILRHLISWAKGEDIDDESKLPHIYHAFCDIMFLVTYTKRNMKEYDDR